MCPSDDYLVNLSELCRENDVLLILDEIQTGFFRTGSFFCSSPYDIKVDFMTMAKGLAGGFPFGAFAMTEEVSEKIEPGDHGGTYCGNPLGCSVSYAVTKFLFEKNIADNVKKISNLTFESLYKWREEMPGTITDVRGKGLLIAVELSGDGITSSVQKECLDNGLLVNVTRGNIIRIFPALNITKEEMEKSLLILKNSIIICVNI